MEAAVQWEPLPVALSLQRGRYPARAVQYELDRFTALCVQVRPLSTARARIEPFRPGEKGRFALHRPDFVEWKPFPAKRFHKSIVGAAEVHQKISCLADREDVGRAINNYGASPLLLQRFA